MKFKLGNIYMTIGICNVIEKNKNYINELMNCLKKYIALDFGDLCDEDINLNFEAIKCNARILGSYNTTNGKIYIITEADRSGTTLLFATEY